MENVLVMMVDGLSLRELRIELGASFFFENAEGSRLHRRPSSQTIHALRDRKLIERRAKIGMFTTPYRLTKKGRAAVKAVEEFRSIKGAIVKAVEEFRS
jgi:DNA-binding HxlR family transcriptional regulator